MPCDDGDALMSLGNQMARQHGDSTYMLARKAPKLYMTGVMEVKVRSITTAAEQNFT